MDYRHWGFKSNIKWVIVNAAPLTRSGLNEIVAGAETRKELEKIAKALDIKFNSRSGCMIVKLDTIPRKADNAQTT